MTTTFIELTEEAFDEQFRTLPNHLNPTAPWDQGDAQGCLFETYGEEYEFIKSHDQSRVWTLVDNNDGTMNIISGLRWINRLGYLITQKPWPAGATVEVSFETKPDEEESP